MTSIVLASRDSTPQVLGPITIGPENLYDNVSSVRLGIVTPNSLLLTTWSFIEEPFVESLPDLTLAMGQPTTVNPGQVVSLGSLPSPLFSGSNSSIDGLVTFSVDLTVPITITPQPFAGGGTMLTSNNPNLPQLLTTASLIPTYVFKNSTYSLRKFMPTTDIHGGLASIILGDGSVDIVLDNPPVKPGISGKLKVYGLIIPAPVL